MLKSSLIIILTAIMSFSAYSAEMTGKVVDLDKVMMGKEAEVSADDAKAMFKEGKLLAFESNGQVYIVYNTDGSIANKNLAKNAGKELKITGKVRQENGINFIIAEKWDWGWKI